MTLDEFNGAMNRLIQDFGPREYPENRMLIIWDHCNDLSISDFNWICTHFLRTKPIKYPPLPEDFIGAAIEKRKHMTGEMSPRKINLARDPRQAGEVAGDVLKRLGLGSNIQDAIKRAKQQGPK